MSDLEIKSSFDMEELRASELHQQLGVRIFAAFLSHQQGISLATAGKKARVDTREDSVGDLWLVAAEIVRELWSHADKKIAATVRDKAEPVPVNELIH